MVLVVAVVSALASEEDVPHAADSNAMVRMTATVRMGTTLDLCM
jgi:hypothetical protein